MRWALLTRGVSAAMAEVVQWLQHKLCVLIKDNNGPVYIFSGLEVTDMGPACQVEKQRPSIDWQEERSCIITAGGNEVGTNKVLVR